MSDKRVTSQDVANLAGVSRTTVSLVLNDVEGIHISPKTRKKVRDAAEKLGLQIATITSKRMNKPEQRYFFDF